VLDDVPGKVAEQISAELKDFEELKSSEAQIQNAKKDEDSKS